MIFKNFTGEYFKSILNKYYIQLIKMTVAELTINNVVREQHFE